MDCRSGLIADWQASRLTGKDQPMILILAIAALDRRLPLRQATGACKR